MTTTVLFEPHDDDCALFAAFEAIRHNAIVVTVLRSFVQEHRGGPTWRRREQETVSAMRSLGLWHEPHWEFPDDRPVWDEVLTEMMALDLRLNPGRVLAPAIEDGGHEHHSMTGVTAAAVFGDRVTHYLTYVRGHGRSTSEHEVVPERWALQRKLRALACYESQHALPDCRPWFIDGQREYLAP